MGKTTKNFSLLMRKGNSRVPMRRLQRDSAAEDAAASTTTTASSSAGQSALEDELSTNGEWKLAGRKIDTDWTLSRSAALKILVSIRLSASLWSIISDCDEVYNYWEPLHLVLFGRGFQTWEYAPNHAIRSWLYVLLYALPVQPLVYLIGSSKLALFFAIRFLIGALCLFAELSLYESVCRRAGNSVGRAFLLFSLLSPAMFGASCAFLPSSFSMALNALAMALWLREQWFLSIFLTASSALVGWPFAALLGLPIVLQMLLFRSQLALKFVLYSFISGSVLLASLCAVDSHLFGKIVIAPLNIVLYNIFSAHGPTLYGVEPASFYVRNLLLNFNVVVPLAVVGFVGLLLIHFVATPKGGKEGQIGKQQQFMHALLHDWPLTRGCSSRANADTMPFVLISLAALLWLAVFFVQPHKEERFLFPVYPHICVLAAVGIDMLRRLLLLLLGVVFVPRSSPFYRFVVYGTTAFCLALALLFVLCSVSRIAAVRRNYAGLMDTYRALNERMQQEHQSGDEHDEELLNFARMRDPIRLCVGKEWHRFPSSFFLPENAVDRHGLRRAVEMEFVRSEFDGILPAHFAPGATLGESTRHTPTGRMNDANRAELDRYVPVESCDFLIHLEDGQETELEPNYAKTAMFRSVDQRQILLPAKSHPILRAFYIPFINSDLTFGTLHLLQKVSPPL
uniref:Mannosyltransferase n=1 Tax=Globodera pallida TaxID=36090 RepID=A0A183BUS5_GLOPA